jgi:hypothetical protein
MILPEIFSTPKAGSELFEFESKNLGFDLSEFWSWNQSNLIENRTRGALAEFIVNKALDIESENRIEWDDYGTPDSTNQVFAILTIFMISKAK